jgi:tRNA(Arg) A34 adenosine deaminase TadA
MLLSSLLLLPALPLALAYDVEIHPEYQQGLSINDVPAERRLHWMRVANEAIYADGHPCPQAPFGTAIVNTTSDQLVCVTSNKVGTTGDPSMHGEISAIRHCTDVLTEKGLSPMEILASWKEFSLYTNGEPCPMCASAIRWAGFKEVIYGSSIKTIAESESPSLLPTCLTRRYAHDTDTFCRWSESDLHPFEPDLGEELQPGPRNADVSVTGEPLVR